MGQLKAWKMYRVEAKIKDSGKWVIHPNIGTTSEVWSLLALLYLESDELIVRGIDGSIHIHVLDNELVFPIVGEGISEQDRVNLLATLKSRMN